MASLLLSITRLLQPVFEHIGKLIFLLTAIGGSLNH